MAVSEDGQHGAAGSDDVAVECDAEDAVDEEKYSWRLVRAMV